MTRTLSLRREALADLTGDDLAAVAGGAREYTGDAVTCPFMRCVTLGGTCLTCICE